MDVVNQFLLAKKIKLDNILFSVLDGTNTMTEKRSGLQKRFKNFSPFNIYINCCNCRLVLCLPHLIKNTECFEVLFDYDAVLL